MAHRLLLSAAFALLLIAGCESPEPADETPAAPATETPAEPAEEAQATPETPVETAVEETEGMDDEGPAVEDIELGGAPADDAAAADTPPDWQYEEGRHFRRLTASQGTSSPPDRIEVAEIFWYGCPHCYDFEPILDEWQENAPADVAFVRIPVVWSPTHRTHARLMYTADALGKLDEMHEAIFEAIHQEGKTLTREADIVALFESFGVSEDEFREAWDLFSVKTAVNRAENLTRRYGIRSVPIIVVNGKYVTEGEEIRSFDDMLGVTGELVERERRDL